jgi:hypothetical protein
MLLAPSVLELSSYIARPGEVGGSWTSASGGGEGMRGDDEGDAGAAIVAIACVVLEEMCEEVCVVRELCYLRRFKVEGSPSRMQVRLGTLSIKHRLHTRVPRLAYLVVILTNYGRR